MGGLAAWVLFWGYPDSDPQMALPMGCCHQPFCELMAHLCPLSTLTFLPVASVWQLESCSLGLFVPSR